MLRRLLVAVAVAFVPFAAGAAGVDDAHCDISLLPAATLLLPYFEVDLDDRLGETTHFTITNVTNAEQIAHVTLWTDRAFPVIDFNIYLTGYDVQSIDLYDVFVNGHIAPPRGTGTQVAPQRGRYSDPNVALNVTACDRLPGPLDDVYVTRMQQAFVHGRVPDLGTLPGCEVVGGTHGNAVGYLTIDTTRICSTSLPTDDGYFRDEVRFDNVLVGDSLQLNAREQRADATPLVHIRAMPDAQFERTFYERIEPSRRDARQPLPSQFAVRWTEGSALRIWRDARTNRTATCAHHPENATLDVSDVVVFDEDENAIGSSRLATELPVTSKTSVADAERYPQMSGATAGWMYLDLDRTKSDSVVTQNWVIGAMALGNGCTAAADLSEFTKRRGAEIAPAPSDDSCDIALLPAATLLLPYFEVDLESGEGVSSRFTITNAGPREQIARVTLWTDLAYAVASFNIALTGYDVHTIDLHDLFAGDAVQPRCGAKTTQLPANIIERMRLAFTEGNLGAACANIGQTHGNATGYATIDVVRTCSDNLPTTPQYWRDDIAFDNVLLGESERTPLVHIRALPEASLARTFYARLQSADAPRGDARQPLPSTFAARWLGAGEATTRFAIWREPESGATCEDEGHAVTFVGELVRFDEAENAVGRRGIHHSPGQQFPSYRELAAASSLDVDESGIFPQLTGNPAGGWLYMNLDHGEFAGHASQNWVVATMEAGGLTASFDAAALDNGCTAPAGYSEVTGGARIIGPARNRRP